MPGYWTARRLWKVFLLLAVLAPAVAPEAPSTPADDLPLVEVPARGVGDGALAVIVSGDGGWSGLDKAVAASLADEGVPTVGLNSLRYFLRRRTPEEASRDLARIATGYLEKWHRERLVLIGYSLGADVLPFMISRLPEELRQRVDLVVLLGPAAEVDFKFHVLSNWLGARPPSTALPVVPEIDKLRGLPVVCVHGAGEKDSPCADLQPSLAEVVELPGAHHFDGDYARVAAMVAERARAAERGRQGAGHP